MGEEFTIWGFLPFRLLWLNKEIIQSESYRYGSSCIHNWSKYLQKEQRKVRKGRSPSEIPLKKSENLVSLTEAEEEEMHKTVHATQHRIVTETDPHPAIIRRTDIAIYETTQKHKRETAWYCAQIKELVDTSFSVLLIMLRVNEIKQDMSEVKNLINSADVLASIQSQVPPVVDKYLGTKLDDALFKTLERHTADLVKKYFVLFTPESSKKQESEKSQEEIIRIKREQEEKKQELTYTIKSTDQAALKEFDLKSALFKFQA
ncbi:hypothetical protein Tco_0371569 [Tanacetum coccineum]